MTKTLPEILEQLKQLDEIDLVELLGVNSEDLIDRFADLVEESRPSRGRDSSDRRQ